MKVLLVVSVYRKDFPYIKDLKRELKGKGFTVNVLDVENMYIVEDNGHITKLVELSLFRPILKVPKIRSYIRIMVLKQFLKKRIGYYDSVGIHSCDLFYAHLIDDFRKITHNLSVTIWGSDFYRATEKARQVKKKILDACDLIVFGNPSNKEDLVSYYNNYGDRSVVCGFGISNFDRIDRILQSKSREEVKKELELPSDSYITTIGYNGMPAQQHEMLIESVRLLPEQIRNKIFLLFQMSYGGSESYKKQVMEKAEACGLPYRIVTHFLSDEETSMIRIATDIVLNAQITDGFSASIQEHIYARNVVIVGDWLKYKSLDRTGVIYLKSPGDQFGTKLTEVVEHFSRYQDIIKKNTDRIYELSSWKSRLPHWVSIYSGKAKREKSSQRI